MIRNHGTAWLAAGIALLALAAVGFAVGSRESATEGECRCDTWRQALDDARVEAVNTDAGITVTIAGSSPEAARLIQEYWQECGRYHLAGLPCPCDSAGCHGDDETPQSHPCGNHGHSGSENEPGCRGCH